MANGAYYSYAGYDHALLNKLTHQIRQQIVPKWLHIQAMTFPAKMATPASLDTTSQGAQQSKRQPGSERQLGSGRKPAAMTLEQEEMYHHMWRGTPKCMVQTGDYFGRFAPNGMASPIGLQGHLSALNPPLTACASLPNVGIQRPQGSPGLRPSSHQRATRTGPSRSQRNAYSGHPALLPPPEGSHGGGRLELCHSAPGIFPEAPLSGDLSSSSLPLLFSPPCNTPTASFTPPPRTPSSKGGPAPNSLKAKRAAMQGSSVARFHFPKSEDGLTSADPSCPYLQYDYYDVLVPESFDDLDMDTSSYAKNYHRLYYTRLPEKKMDTEDLKKKYNAPEALRKQLQEENGGDRSEQYQAKRMPDVKTLATWVKKLQPRSIQDYKPMFTLCQALLNEILDQEVKLADRALEMEKGKFRFEMGKMTQDQEVKLADRALEMEKGKFRFEMGKMTQEFTVIINELKEELKSRPKFGMTFSSPSSNLASVVKSTKKAEEPLPEHIQHKISAAQKWRNAVDHPKMKATFMSKLIKAVHEAESSGTALKEALAQKAALEKYLEEIGAEMQQQIDFAECRASVHLAQYEEMRAELNKFVKKSEFLQEALMEGRSQVSKKGSAMTLLQSKHNELHSMCDAKDQQIGALEAEVRQKDEMMAVVHSSLQWQVDEMRRFSQGALILQPTHWSLYRSSTLDAMKAEIGDAQQESTAAISEDREGIPRPASTGEPPQEDAAKGSQAEQEALAAESAAQAAEGGHCAYRIKHGRPVSVTDLPRSTLTVAVQKAGFKEQLEAMRTQWSIVGSENATKSLSIDKLQAELLGMQAEVKAMREKMESLVHVEAEKAILEQKHEAQVKELMEAAQQAEEGKATLEGMHMEAVRAQNGVRVAYMGVMRRLKFWLSKQITFFNFSALYDEGVHDIARLTEMEETKLELSLLFKQLEEEEGTDDPDFAQAEDIERIAQVIRHNIAFINKELKGKSNKVVFMVRRMDALHELDHHLELMEQQHRNLNREIDREMMDLLQARAADAAEIRQMKLRASSRSWDMTRLLQNSKTLRLDHKDTVLQLEQRLRIKDGSALELLFGEHGAWQWVTSFEELNHLMHVSQRFLETAFNLQ
ncbi:hypothetical protein CYMTET_13363 [Cymbomonas tetramitiformis]|uniref:Uncharacterized protein n=1 Tax=Cymbomonas tetramitiformis TaxID=36881 RepID=A0AAE0GIP2_9CHLO|nr:hypothetical protein CYMTET_13363 [Cymbomonas tetramitiformis]